MNIFQTCLRWAHRIFWYSIVGIILIIAVAISLIRIFPPDVEAYREQIEELASTVIGQQVQIKSMDARLSGFTPIIIFNDVHLMDETGKREIIRFEKASLGLDLYRSIVNKKLSPRSFTIHGVKLGITRKRNGNFLIKGLDLKKLEEQLGATTDIADAEANELSEWLFKHSELAIKDSTVVWVDRIRGRKTRRFEHVNFFIRNDNERHQLTGTVRLPDELGRDFEVAFDFDGNILNPDEWQGTFYANGKGLQVTNWGIKPGYLDASIQAGVLDVKLWGEWHKGNINSITADISTYDVDIKFEKDKAPVYIGLTSGLVNWQRNNKGWLLNIANFRYRGDEKEWPGTNIIVKYDVTNGEAPQLSAYSGFIRLNDVKRILLEGGFLDKKSLELITTLNPVGDLSEFNLTYQQKGEQTPDFSISTRFKDLSIDAWKQLPGFHSVDGKLRLNQQLGELKLENSVSRLDIPKLFRQPFEVTRLDGTVNWWHDTDAWHVTAKDFYLSTSDIDTDLSFLAIIPDKDVSPYLDLQVQYKNGDARQAWRYYPVTIMDDKLVDWLDTGIVDGRVVSGGAIFNGRFDKFPFKDQSGTLLAHFDARDVELNYQKGWPHLQQIAADVRITGLGLAIQGDSSSIYNSQMKNAQVVINEFSAPVLSVKGDIHGNTNDLIQYLVNSPIAPEAEKFYAQSKVTGSSTGKLKIFLPLSRKMSETVSTHYEGFVNITNSNLSAWQGKLDVRNVNGHLEFNPRGVFSEKLTGLVYGGKTNFNLFTQKVNGSQDIKLGMQGTLNTSDVPRYIDLKLLNKISGHTEWQGVLSFGYKNKKSSLPGNFQFATNMKGVTVNLPKPFTKVKDELLDLAAEIQFPEDELLHVNVRYGKKLTVNLLVNTDIDKSGMIKKGTIQFLEQQASLPAEDQLVIRGGLLEFPVDEWQDIVEKDQGKNNKPVLDTLGAPVVLDMDFLHLVTRDDGKQRPAPDPMKSALINGQIADFKVDDRHFGKMDIKTSRRATGISIDKLQILTPGTKVNIEGSWLLRKGQQQTNLIITVNTSDLGKMLGRLGYSAIIDKGEAKAIMQAYWFDSPNRFELEKLNGTLGIVIDDGLIMDVQPGAGRMLGLLSISELPRRLLLDFGELREGFKFKQIYGQFEIEDGDATTNNLSVISPIAFIGIKGRTGLAKRDFDQQVSVVPNVSGTLPAITWLLGGGQIGAFTFILDQLFGSEVNKKAATEYRITGSWEKPIITKLKTDKPAKPDQDETTE